MVIIFGTRSYFRRSKATQFGFCDHCNRYSKMQSYTARKFFHLYYVPLIPTEGLRRTHKSCNLCQKMVVYEPSVMDGIVEAFKSQAAEAILSISDGEVSFVLSNDPEIEPTDAAEYLHGLFDWFYATKNMDFCLSILNQLTAPNARYAHRLLSSCLDMYRGKIDNAIVGYGDASTIRSESPFSFQWKAALLAQRKRRQESIETYLLALERVKEPQGLLSIHWNLAEQYFLVKQYSDSGKHYKATLELRPDLIHDAAFAKRVKKLEKKTGVSLR